MKSSHSTVLLDVSSKRDSGFWRYIITALFLVLIYGGCRNYYFVASGMLRPDFGLIHKCYDFNLWELPWTLIVIGSGMIFFGFFLNRKLWGSAGVFILIAFDLFALRYYVTHIEPNRHVVRHIRLASPKLTQTLRLLHISDIQSGGIGAKERALFLRIAELEPDIIINTGDYLQPVPPHSIESEFPKLITLIRSLNPKYGTWGVYGDTDYLLYRFSLNEFSPMHLLSSRSIRVPIGGERNLSLHGLNLNQSKDFNYARRSIEDWLKNSNSDDFRILLGHAPDFALGVGELPIDLCLAGHTHGGQFRIPWYGPIVTDSKVPLNWSSGFRRIGTPYLNVSAGAGSNRFEGLPPMRLNCPTEMTLIELIPMNSVR